ERPVLVAALERVGRGAEIGARRIRGRGRGRDGGARLGERGGQELSYLQLPALLASSAEEVAGDLVRERGGAVSGGCFRVAHEGQDAAIGPGRTGEARLHFGAGLALESSGCVTNERRRIGIFGRRTAGSDPRALGDRAVDDLVKGRVGIAL